MSAAFGAEPDPEGTRRADSLAKALISVADVERWFGADRQTAALRGVSLQILPGEFVAIVGPSGSGKSTLLNVMGLLDRPDAGHVFIGERDVWQQRPAERARLRLCTTGFVFQQHHLLPYLNARDNVALPHWRAFGDRTQARARADALLDAVGLAHRRDARAPALSVGEAQRVAIARAAINEPAVILADEPTGALDSESAMRVVELLSALCHQGRALALVTHDERVAAHASRTVLLRDGRIED